jgi:glucose/mannose-6-phosphate isomerase
MPILDDIDLSSMRETVQAFPDLLTILELSDDLMLFIKNARTKGFDGIGLLGMGGSSIAGEMSRGLLWGDTHVPIVSIREYDLPGFITEEWFIIAVSYSGNTEETLSALQQAMEIGCPFIVITTGGKMIEIAGDAPSLRLPRGIQPRAALPLLFSAEYGLLQLLVKDRMIDLKETSEWLKKRMDDWGKALPTPAEFAAKVRDQIPLFFGSGHLTPVAYRAKCQVNENSKMVAFHAEIPEGNHNEIEGSYGYMRRNVVPVFLRSDHESKRVKQRIDITSDIFSRYASHTLHLEFKDGTKLQEALAITHYLDMVSVELAELHDVDPVSVERIAELKNRLRLSDS